MEGAIFPTSFQTTQPHEYKYNYHRFVTKPDLEENFRSKVRSIEYQQKRFDRLIALIAYNHFRSFLIYENLPPQPSLQLEIRPLL